MQIERLIGVLTDQVRVLSEWSRVNLIDVKCIGKPSVFQNDESKFYEWVKKIENCLIRIEPHLEAMLTWALENETEIRQSIIADEFGSNGEPTEQAEGVCAGSGWCISKLYWHVSRKEKAGRSCRCVVKTDWRRGDCTSVSAH